MNLRNEEILDGSCSSSGGSSSIDECAAVTDIGLSTLSLVEWRSVFPPRLFLWECKIFVFGITEKADTHGMDKIRCESFMFKVLILLYNIRGPLCVPC